MWKSIQICLLLVSVVGFTVAARADESIFERDALLGDLGGVRSIMEEHGLSLDIVYTAEGFWNARGGMTTHGAREYRGDVSVFLELDTETAGWWDNGTFFVHLQEQHGHGITDKYVGDFQVLSNMDADDYKQISELWYRHTFFDEQFWFKFGKQEANEDFACGDHCGEFIASCPGFSPTIPLVTFPDQDWGAVLGIAPCDAFSMNVGVFQARSNGGRSVRHTLDKLYGPLVLVEPAIHYDVADQPGTLHLGAWWSGDKFDELDDDDPNPGVFGESHGWYLMLDQRIWSENPGDENDEQGIDLFGRYGWAPEDRSEAEHYFGGGVQWAGALSSRDDDVLGLGAFHVDFSDEADFTESGETAIEFFYKAQLCGWLSIKPDVQYILNPGGVKENDDALAIGLRCEVSL